MTCEEKCEAPACVEECVLENDLEGLAGERKLEGPLGDLSAEILENQFERILSWLDSSLGDSFYKGFVVTQVRNAFDVVTTLVRNAI
jgi:hypothetical protein